jgi:mono/diheme cytochrome c family protein
MAVRMRERNLPYNINDMCHLLNSACRPSGRLLALALMVASLAAGAALSDAPKDEPPAPSQPPTDAPAPTMGRGMLLYENHCIGCHESRLHVREHRSARNMTELRQWVARWTVQQKLTWDANDVDDVTRYLNLRYYKFPPEAAH